MGRLRRAVDSRKRLWSDLISTFTSITYDVEQSTYSDAHEKRVTVEINEIINTVQNSG